MNQTEDMIDVSAVYEQQDREGRWSENSHIAKLNWDVIFAQLILYVGNHSSTTVVIAIGCHWCNAINMMMLVLNIHTISSLKPLSYGMHN